MSEAQRMRAFHLALSLVVFWGTYQALLNLHRYLTIEQNVASLSQELNVSGEREFRRRLLSILDTSRLDVTDEDIAVTFDPSANAWTITVPGMWAIDFIVWRWEVKTEHQLRVRRWEISGS